LCFCACFSDSSILCLPVFLSVSLVFSWKIGRAPSATNLSS
jgi:hypothetical protein